jgi:hypothetical protein
VTTRTLFLRPEESTVFALPYGRARAALDEADAARARVHENDMARAGQLRRQAAKLRNIGINSGSDLLQTKTRQLTERAARIEAAARPAHREAPAGAVRLAGEGSPARALVSIDPKLGEAKLEPDRGIGGTELNRTPQRRPGVLQHRDGVGGRARHASRRQRN